MKRIDDYFFRLKSASPGEIVYRIKRFALAHRLKKALRRKDLPVPAFTIAVAANQRMAMPKLQICPQASRYHQEDDPTPFTLNTDIRAIRDYEKCRRHLFFSDAAKGRDEVDIRAVWEKGRLQKAVVLMAAVNSGCGNALKKNAYGRASALILDWIDENPFLRGLHYISPMECGLRIPVLVYALNRIEDLSAGERSRLLKVIYQHGWWVFRNLSLYASLGNHTISECVGLVFAGAVFRKTKEGRAWMQRGIQLLVREACHQILDDGGPAEQSFGYHRFVLDLYWMVVDFLEANGWWDGDHLKPRLLKGEDFLRALAPRNGNRTDIGDCDDSHAVAPGVAPNRMSPGGPCPQGIRTYAQSGYTVIRGADGLLLTFDHGPLGMAPLYNHGHADALSITLAYRETPVLIDPGTFRYNGAPHWRHYFKGTRAHNTVVVDGRDQAEQASRFIWTKPYRSFVRHRRFAEGQFSIEAYHDGYCRLTSPVRHFRKITFWEPDALILHDRFTGRGRHEFEINFHLGDTCDVDHQNHWWRLNFGLFTVHLKVFQPIQGTLTRGQTDPPLGWHSPAYGIKKPSGVITFKAAGLARHVTFTTAIVIDDGGSGRAHEATA